MYDAGREGKRLSIFLSYRRDDSSGHTGRICEHLGGIFGADKVFMDIEDIAPGEDFIETIEKNMSACQVVLVVIGPRWIAEIQKRAGGRDMVRLELGVALRRGVKMIPVLVGGVSMPPPSDFPDDLAVLSRHQAVEIRDTRFDDDLRQLTQALMKVPGLCPQQRPIPNTWRTRALFAAALVAAIAAIFLWKQQPARPLEAQQTARSPAQQTAFEIDGAWIAEMQKPNQPPFQVRLNLAGQGGRITGSIAYPTGDAAIQDGKLENGQLSFFTVHTLQFASGPVTIRWTGVIGNGQLRLTEADEGGIGRGAAHRQP